jgi:hypothetical protein
MPKGGERLAPEAIEVVRNWIDRGAKGENSTEVATASAPESPPPISIKPSDVFVPYGGRKAIEAGHSLEKRQASAPVVPLPGVLIVEEDTDKAPNRVVEPYTKGLIGKIGPLPAVTALAFSPQGKSLLVGLYGRVVVWDLVESGIDQELNDVAGSVNDLMASCSRWSVANPFLKVRFVFTTQGPSYALFHRSQPTRKRFLHKPSVRIPSG